ncbi:MAG: hypothetical protein LC687_04935 [Actinobacteria bacterium]|nr:hypothetical protein [Actinomycetota bacterium]MCA1807179.1 hypothetical protein [Actinomycetota bacterium]
MDQEVSVSAEDVINRLSMELATALRRAVVAESSRDDALRLLEEHKSSATTEKTTQS